MDEKSGTDFERVRPSAKFEIYNIQRRLCMFSLLNTTAIVVFALKRKLLFATSLNELYSRTYIQAMVT
jgi:hypothetical protein